MWCSEMQYNCFFSVLGVLQNTRHFTGHLSTHRVKNRYSLCTGLKEHYGVESSAGSASLMQAWRQSIRAAVVGEGEGWAGHFPSGWGSDLGSSGMHSWGWEEALKPGRQVHLYEPSVLEHTPFLHSSTLSLMSLHSFISERGEQRQCEFD